MRTSTHKPKYRKKETAPPVSQSSPHVNIPDFYFDQYNQGEASSLARAQTGTLQQEIGLLRVITRRLVEMSSSETEPDAILKNYRTVALICSRIAVLQRAVSAAEVNRDTHGLSLDDIQAVMDDALLQARGNL